MYDKHSKLNGNFSDNTSDDDDQLDDQKNQYNHEQIDHADLNIGIDQQDDQEYQLNHEQIVRTFNVGVELTPLNNTVD